MKKVLYRSQRIANFSFPASGESSLRSWGDYWPRTVFASHPCLWPDAQL